MCWMRERQQGGRGSSLVGGVWPVWCGHGTETLGRGGMLAPCGWSCRWPSALLDWGRGKCGMAGSCVVLEGALLTFLRHSWTL